MTRSARFTPPQSASSLVHYTHSESFVNTRGRELARPCTMGVYLKSAAFPAALPVLSDPAAVPAGAACLPLVAAAFPFLLLLPPLPTPSVLALACDCDATFLGEATADREGAPLAVGGAALPLAPAMVAQERYVDRTCQGSEQRRLLDHGSCERGKAVGGKGGSSAQRG